MHPSAGPRVRDEIQRMRPQENFVYRLLAHTRPQLCLDVGAAAGGTTKMMKRFAPDARVIAFEPFPGNFPYFEETTRGLAGVTLVRKAVSHAPGRQNFHVGQVVEAETAQGHWTVMPGYSSVGMLVDNAASGAGVLTVETCRLDDLPHERVGFLKIDVQGGEYAVLDGARDLLFGAGVDMIYAEFSGDGRVLQLLDAYGYDVFDTAYVIFRPDHPIEPALHQTRQIAMSTGASGCVGYLIQPIGRHFSAYCQLFSHGGFQTDLLAIRRERTDEMLALIATLPKA